MELPATTNGNEPRENGRLRYHPGGFAFGLILVTMLLPWLSFSYNCTETTGSQSAYELLASHDVRLSEDIDTTGGTFRESRTIRIPGQWEIRVVAPLALLGLVLTLVPGILGSVSRGTISLVCATLTAFWTESAETLDRDWISSQSSRWNPYDAQADYGAFVTIYLLLLIAALNFTLPRGAPRSSTLNYIVAGIFYLLGTLISTIVFAIVIGAIAASG